MINLDIVETGYYEVWLDGNLLSQHSKEKKAVAKALEEKAKNNDAVIEIKPPTIQAVANTFNTGDAELLKRIKELENKNNTLMEENEILRQQNSLFISSRISVSKNAEVTDTNGLNLVISNQNVEITVLNELDVPLGSVLMYKQNGNGNVIIKGDIETKQTYSKDDVISLLKTEDNWEYLNPPKQ